jgi:nicotinamidase-related amidase
LHHSIASYEFFRYWEAVRMRALLVVDAQNEFSAGGLRPVPEHDAAAAAIRRHVAAARRDGRPIAWIQHYNKPTESRAFVPDTWGSEFSPGMGPRTGYGPERRFEKDVYGAFTATGLEAWLRGLGVTDLVIVGFYAHMCLSTSGREALVRGFAVAVDPEATGARDLENEHLGRQSAADVRRSALLQLVDMGATIAGAGPVVAESTARAVSASA